MKTPLCGLYDGRDFFLYNGIFKVVQEHVDQVTKLRLSCYPVLLSIDSKTR